MLAKKEARPQMWKSGRATKSKASVPQARLRGRASEMESTREGRAALGGLGAAAMFCALLAFVAADQVFFM